MFIEIVKYLSAHRRTMISQPATGADCECELTLKRIGNCIVQLDRSLKRVYMWRYAVGEDVFNSLVDTGGSPARRPEECPLAASLAEAVSGDDEVRALSMHSAITYMPSRVASTYDFAKIFRESVIKKCSSIKSQLITLRSRLKSACALSTVKYFMDVKLMPRNFVKAYESLQGNDHNFIRPRICLTVVPTERIPVLPSCKHRDSVCEDQLFHIQEDSKLTTWRPVTSTVNCSIEDSVSTGPLRLYTAWQTLRVNIGMMPTNISILSTLLFASLLSILSYLRISNRQSTSKSLLILVLLCTAQPSQSFLSSKPQLGLRTRGETAMDGTFIVPLIGSPNTGYCVMIAIGIDTRQEFCVLVDTGSSNLAVAGNDNEDIDRWFHVEDSTSYTDQGKSVTVTYTAGQWTGRLSRDHISVGGSQEVEVFFAVITESQNFFIHDAEWVGIMGLAYSSLAKPDSSVTPFWDTFRAATGMRDVFSLQLCQPLDIPLLDITEPQGGRMVLGGFNGSYYHPPMLYTSIVQEKFYNVLVTNLTVGDTVVNLDCSEFNNDQSIVDSGTTDIYFPQKVFTELRNILIQDFKDGIPLIVPESFWNGGAKLAWPVDDKHTIYNAFPTLYIAFASDGTPDEGFSLAVTPQIYLRQVEGTAAEQQQLNCFPECDFFTFGIKQRQRGTVIGGNVMLGFYTVFDRENKRVGFAQSTCQFQDTDSEESIPHIVGPYPREPVDCSCSVCGRKPPYWEIISYVCGGIVLPLAVIAVCIAASGKVIQCYRSRNRRRYLLVNCCQTCRKNRDDDEHLGSSDVCSTCMMKCKKSISPCCSAFSCCCYRKGNFTLLRQPTDEIGTADIECDHLSHTENLIPQHQSNDDIDVVIVDSESSGPHTAEETVETGEHSQRGSEPEESETQTLIESGSYETTAEIHSEGVSDDITNDLETSESAELIPRPKLVLSRERGHGGATVIAPVVETGTAGNMQKLSAQFEDLEQDRKAASAKEEVVRTKPVIFVGPKRNHIKPPGCKESVDAVENPKLTNLEKEQDEDHSSIPHETVNTEGDEDDSEKTVNEIIPQLITSTDEEETSEINLKTNDSEHPSYNVSCVVPIDNIFQDTDKLECMPKEKRDAVACKQGQTDSGECGDKSLKAGPVQKFCDVARQVSSSSSASSGTDEISRQSSWSYSRQNSSFSSDDGCPHKYTKRQHST